MNTKPTLTILETFPKFPEARLGYAESSPEKEILAAIQRTDFILHRTTVQKIEVYRLTNTTSGTRCIFVCGEDGVVHILMFEVSAESEGRYFAAMRDFKALYEIFITKLGFLMLQGHALDNTKGNPITHREWRNDRVKIGGKNFQKLHLFWLRLGGIELEGAIVFLAPKLAMRAKSLAALDSMENPYKFLSRHSVFDSEFSAQLRAN